MRFVNLGTIDYDAALALQRELQAKRIAGQIADTVLMLEHPPVLTMGRSARARHVLAPPEVLRDKGIAVHEVGRGGDVTYHGPGQLVVYPILDLKPDRQDVRKYVWSLEEAMIRTCGDFDLEAVRVQGLNGAWVEDRKIGAVGVRISRWVTMHGLALNANTDLSHFDWIVPCGIQGKAVTSISRELGRDVSVDALTDRIASHLAALYDSSVVWERDLEASSLS